MSKTTLEKTTYGVLDRNVDMLAMQPTASSTGNFSKAIFQ
jgi:hypothetical protein